MVCHPVEKLPIAVYPSSDSLDPQLDRPITISNHMLGVFFFFFF